MSTKDRIKAIQARLDLDADGLIGPATLTAIEQLLDDVKGEVSSPDRLACSRVGLDALVGFEISSEGYYNQKLRHPTWPGGGSGVTIGIGYDLGYCTVAKFRRDWGGKIADADVAALERVCGLKGAAAKAKLQLQSVKKATVPLAAAREVFLNASLPEYARKTRQAWPGVEQLPGDAAAALLSLVFNRGTKKSGDSRKEMAAITALVKASKLSEIADQVTSMKRLWKGKNLQGLLDRRDREAELIRGAKRVYATGELVML